MTTHWSQPRSRIESLPERVDSMLQTVDDIEAVIWLFVLAAMTADVYLTYVGLKYGLTEANPLMRVAMHGAGFAMLGLVKVLVLGVAGLLRDALPDHGPVIPLGLAIPWCGAVIVNLVVLSPVL